MRKTLFYMILSVGIRYYIHHFAFILQWFDNIFQKFLTIFKKLTNYVFSGRTNRQAVGCFIASSKRKALPHRCCFCIIYFVLVCFRIFAVGNLLHPIGEATGKFSIVVRITGGEIEMTISANGSYWTGSYAQFTL